MNNSKQFKCQYIWCIYNSGITPALIREHFISACVCLLKKCLCLILIGFKVGSGPEWLDCDIMTCFLIMWLSGSFSCSGWCCFSFVCLLYFCSEGWSYWWIYKGSAETCIFLILFVWSAVNIYLKIWIISFFKTDQSINYLSTKSDHENMSNILLTWDGCHI